MTATDHRGETVRSTIGDYDFIFNNTWFNTSSNLSGQTQKIIPLDANLAAGDYIIAVWPERFELVLNQVLLKIKS